jgi:benzoyl-CoA reductase/2-hydroxyglutaryl-CoA dehydratase subunit BcrC/BadD/HgdB
VLVYNTNQCRDVQEWLAFYQRRLGVPLLGVQTPQGVDEVTADHLRGVAAQHRALVPPLEQVAGRRLDPDRLREVVAASYRCTRGWKRVLQTAARRPAPLTFFDAAIHMAPAVVLRGDPRAESYYEALAAELDRRLAGGEAAVQGEAHRLYWEGMPIWGRLRDTAELLAGLQAAVVASTYCNSWVFEGLGHEGDPFEAMARAYTELFIVRSEAVKERYLEAMVRDFGVDAVVYHDARTCPSNSNTRYGLPGRLAERLGRPYVVLQGDLNDLRQYSEEQARTKLEALVEQLEEDAGS